MGPLAGVSGLDVARAAASAAPGRPVLWIDELERAAGVIRERVQPREGDLLVTVGAGDVFKVGERARSTRDRASGSRVAGSG